jgi:hypothetical protein
VADEIGTFAPEVWSTKIIDEYKFHIEMVTRSYGTRLLRAAAEGEDWTKIKRVEEFTHDGTNFQTHFADAAAYAMACRIDNDIRNAFTGDET